MLEDWAIVDGDMNKLPADGKTMGEIVMRGNTLMSGYLKNPQATENIFSGEWFKSGDLAVMHPDQYLQVKDRAKDIIISGGENISSVEVENVITKHPRVSLAAVVAMPNDKWGETPCAFVELTATDDNTDEKTLEQELIAFCKEKIGFKRPGRVVFGTLPKTATGKIQKYELREKTKKLL